jgi:lia operon protein LiaF
MIRRIGGLVLIALGTIFLLNNLGIAHLSVRVIFEKWWPAIFILVGLSLLIRHLRK